MNCEQSARLVHPYVDGELDLMTSLGLEEHLEQCAACARLAREERALRGVLAERLSHHPAPAALRRSVAEGTRPGAVPCQQPWWRTWRLAWVPAAALAALLAWNVAPQLQPDAERVAAARAEKLVYHVNSSDDVPVALRNLANLLETAPQTRIVVVAHNLGVDFLLDGARDRDGQAYEPAVARLKNQGVDFRVCRNTLNRRGIDTSRVVREAVLVPSGIAEISRLQAREGYVYMKL